MGMTTTHPLEDRARLRKAARMADRFRATVLADNPDASDAHVAALAGMATEQLWRDIAELADVTPPSERTIELARGYLAVRAENAGLDPFRGLPS